MDYQQLYSDFPELFHREPNGIHPFDHEGFQCGPGWLPLIHELASRTVEHAKQNGLQLKTWQIKSKFDSLRWYIGGRDEVIGDWVNEAVEQSQHLCEFCGAELTDHTCQAAQIYAELMPVWPPQKSLTPQGDMQ